MRLEISLKEVNEVIQNYTHINVRLKNLEKDKIRASYYVSINILIKEVKDDEIVFSYELSGLVQLLAKIAIYLWKIKLDFFDGLELNIKANEVTLDLKKIKELREPLTFLYISELHFIDEIIFLELGIKK